MDTLKEYTYRGYNIEIIQDDDPMSPLGEELLGTVIHTHSKHVIGHKKLSVDEIKEIESREDVVSLPYYIYSHGDIQVSTTPFSCKWDSGQVGIIYVTEDKIKEELEVQEITPEVLDNVKQILIAEVTSLNKYFNGGYVGYFITDSQGNFKDSCCGFYDEDLCKKEAEDVVEYYTRPNSIKLGEELCKEEEL